MNERRGAIGLWLVAVILGVLALAGMWRSFATHHLRRQSHDVELEWRFLALARSLIAGLEAQIRSQINADKPLAEIVRRTLEQPDSTWVDLLRVLDAKKAQAPLARPEFAGFVLEKLEAGLAYRTPLPGSHEEKVAVLVCRATVRLPVSSGRNASRTLEVARSIKVSRTMIDPELSRYGLFIASADGITDLALANAIGDDLARRVRRLHQAVVAVRDASSGSTRREYDLVLDQMVDPTQPKAIPNKLTEARKFAFYGLIPKGARQDLSLLELAGNLSKGRARIDQLQSRWEAELASHPEGASKAAMELGRALTKGLWAIWAYQQAYKILPLDGSREALVIDKLARLMHPDHLAPRAHWILRDDPEGASAEDQLYAIIGKPGLTSGVIAVENAKKPIRLTGMVRGALLVSVGPGGAVLDSINAEPKPGEYLTVHARSGPVTIRGTCRAIVILGEPRAGEPAPSIEFASGARLEGALYMMKRPEGFPDSGLLVHTFSTSLIAMLVSDGYRAQGLFAVVSPRILYQRVTRS